MLNEIERQLARLAEKLQMDVFGPATAKPLLTSAITALPTAGQPSPQVQASQPIVLSGIELLDPELNSPCLDLFNTLVQGSQADRFDAVVMEATKILEHRLRQAANLDSGYDGIKLVAAALSGSNPPIRLSSHQGEQDAGHMLFWGCIRLREKSLSSAPDRNWHNSVFFRFWVWWTTYCIWWRVRRSRASLQQQQAEPMAGAFMPHTPFQRDACGRVTESIRRTPLAGNHYVANL